MSDPVSPHATDPENPHLPETPAHASDVDPEEAVGTPDIDPEATAGSAEPADAPVELGDEPQSDDEE